MKLLGSQRWLLALVLAGVLMLFGGIFRIHWVSGESMAPTLRDGDWLLVARRGFAGHPPNRGEVVVACVENTFWVKRVVGLPGESVEVRGGQVLIQGQPLNTGAPQETGILDLGRGRLLSDRYALLGDNRDVSASFAEQAVVSRGDLVGPVVMRIFPRPGKIR